MDKVIFIDSLENVAPVTSRVSTINTERGMLYLRGYPIDVLAEKASWEEVIHLLLFGWKPSEKEIKTLKRMLSVGQYVPSGTINAMTNMGPRPDLFNIITTGVLSIPGHETLPPPFEVEAGNAKKTYEVYFGDKPATDSVLNNFKEDMRRVISLVAAMPILVAHANAIRKADKPKLIKSEVLPFDNFIELSGLVFNEKEKKAFITGQIICAEHEMNASTLTVRTAASAGSDIYKAVAAGLATFAGPYHGRASQFVIKMLNEIGNPTNVIKWVDQKLALPGKKKIIWGCGHRVYKGPDGDPRAKILKEETKKLTKNSKDQAIFNTTLALENYIGEKKNLCANVDLYFALTNHFIGFKSCELYPAIFAMARVSGLGAHYLEQKYNPEGRILRPRVLYDGPSLGRQWQ